MKLTSIRFTLSSITAGELELNRIGEYGLEDECLVKNIGDNQTVSSIELFHDDFVHGLTVVMSDVTRHEIGITSGTNRTLYFTEAQQPVGLYGVTNDQGLIEGLGFIKYVCATLQNSLDERGIIDETAADEQVGPVFEVDIANFTVNDTTPQVTPFPDETDESPEEVNDLVDDSDFSWYNSTATETDQPPDEASALFSHDAENLAENRKILAQQEKATKILVWLCIWLIALIVAGGCYANCKMKENDDQIISSHYNSKPSCMHGASIDNANDNNYNTTVQDTEIGLNGNAVARKYESNRADRRVSSLGEVSMPEQTLINLDATEDDMLECRDVKRIVKFAEVVTDKRSIILPNKNIQTSLGNNQTFIDEPQGLSGVDGQHQDLQ